MTGSSFGKTLREFRTNSELSLGMLAADVGYSKGYLSKVENGQSKASSDLAKKCDAQFRTRIFTELVEHDIREERRAREQATSMSSTSDRHTATNTGSFEEFYRATVESVTAFVRALGVAPDNTAVIVQDTMLACLQRWHMIDNPSAWVRAVARRKVADHWRGEVRRRDELGYVVDHEVAEVVSPQSPSAETTALSDARLVALCQRLPPQQKAIFVRTLAGLDLREIAAELGISEAGARSSLRKARQTLRVAVGREAVQNTQDIGDLPGEGQACEQLAVMLLRAQRLTEAASSWKRAAEAYREAGLYMNASKALLDLGAALNATGKFEAATRIFDQAAAVLSRDVPETPHPEIPQQQRRERRPAHSGHTPLSDEDIRAVLASIDCTTSGADETLTRAAQAFSRHGDALRAHACPQARDVYRFARALHEKAGQARAAENTYIRQPDTWP